MEATVWTKEDCLKCCDVKESLKKAGYEIKEKNALGLSNGDEFNPEALMALAEQNFSVPLVFVDGKYSGEFPV